MMSRYYNGVLFDAGMFIAGPASSLLRIAQKAE